MSVTTGIILSENGIAELSERLGEPGWMKERRLAAFKAYQSMDLPRWDRTHLTGLSLDSLTIYADPPRVSTKADLPDSLQRLVEDRGEAANLFVQVDSGPSWRHVSDALAKDGVIVADFPTAVREHEDLVKKYFGTTVAFDEDKLIALHYAAVSSGFFVYVPKNKAVEIPIELRIFASAEGVGVFPHILIVADEGAEVTVVEGVASEDGSTQRVVSEVVEICPQPGAQVRFGAIQNWGSETYNFTTRRAFLTRDSKVEWVPGEFGSALTRSHAKSILNGSGSESYSLGVFFGERNQHIDMGITMLHEGDHTSSDMVTKGVLTDRGRVVYRGLTDIENGARFTSAFQRENTMLLSEHARSDAIPGLEIDETEVQAGHAATVGQIDKVQLFYLMSRGLPRNEAIYLIVSGFFDPILQRVPIEGVRHELEALIDGRMRS